LADSCDFRLVRLQGAGHDPDSGIAYWADVRQALRSPRAEKAFVEVQEENQLDSTEAIALFETAGVQEQPFIG